MLAYLLYLNEGFFSVLADIFSVKMRLRWLQKLKLRVGSWETNNATWCWCVVYCSMMYHGSVVDKNS